MRAFIDTSSLVKRYLEEPGSQTLEKVLDDVSEIAVSPLTWVEMNAALARHVRAKSASAHQVEELTNEAKRDFEIFHKVLWTEALETTAIHLVTQYPLSTLDSIQLASGILSKAEMFITSDRGLFNEARKEIEKTIYV